MSPGVVFGGSLSEQRWPRIFGAWSYETNLGPAGWRRWEKHKSFSIERWLPCRRSIRLFLKTIDQTHRRNLMIET